MNTFDPLMAFAEWWNQQAFTLPPAPFESVTFLRDFTGFVLYRQPPWQVQLWLCRPGAKIPDHSHPNIDSVVIYVSGEIFFRKNGLPSIPSEEIRMLPNGMTSKHGTFERVLPSDSHGADIGPNGGAFITVQHWLNGTPSETELDWRGDPLDPEHAKSLDIVGNTMPWRPTDQHFKELIKPLDDPSPSKQPDPVVS